MPPALGGRGPKVIFSVTRSGKRVYFRNVHRSRIPTRLRTSTGSTVQLSDPWSCPCARSLGDADVKDIDGDLHARSPRSSLQAATCAASAPCQRGHVVCAGFYGRVRIEMHHAAQKLIDWPLYASKKMCRPCKRQRSSCTCDIEHMR